MQYKHLIVSYLILTFYHEFPKTLMSSKPKLHQSSKVILAFTLSKSVKISQQKMSY